MARVAMKRDLKQLEEDATRLLATYTKAHKGGVSPVVAETITCLVRAIRGVRVRFLMPKGATWSEESGVTGGRKAKKQLSPPRERRVGHFLFRMKPELHAFLLDRLAALDLDLERFPYFIAGLISSRAISVLIALVGTGDAAREAVARFLPECYTDFDLKTRNLSIPILTSIVHRHRWAETDAEKANRDVVLPELALFIDIKDRLKRTAADDATQPVSGGGKTNKRIRHGRDGQETRRHSGNDTGSDTSTESPVSPVSSRLSWQLRP